MKNNYILIDFENVQPMSLKILHGHPIRVLLFVGTNQTKVPIDLVTEMQALGDKARYVQIEGNGRNALDFHLAFYAGQLTNCRSVVPIGSENLMLYTQRRERSTHSSDDAVVPEPAAHAGRWAAYAYQCGGHR